MSEKNKGNPGRWCLVALATVLFILVTYLVVTGHVQNTDLAISKSIYAIRSPGLTTLMEGLTYLGNWESITIMCLLLLIFPKTRISYGLPAALAALITTLVKAAVKGAVARPRPDVMYHLIQQGGYSYPSGHAITSISVFVILAIMVQRKVKDRKKANLWSGLLLIPALAIGLSRIYLGVHYPSDVLGGWCAGLGVAFVLWIFMDKVEKSSILDKLERKDR